MQGQLRCPPSRQLVIWLKVKIAGGELQPGQVVPSATTLAQCLQVSEGDVNEAYATLMEEAYITTNEKGENVFTEHPTPSQWTQLYISVERTVKHGKNLGIDSDELGRFVTYTNT